MSTNIVLIFLPENIFAPQMLTTVELIHEDASTQPAFPMPDPPQSTPTSSSSFPTILVAGVSGGFIALVCTGMACWLWIRRKKRGEQAFESLEFQELCVPKHIGMEVPATKSAIHAADSRGIMHEYVAEKIRSGAPDAGSNPLLQTSKVAPEIEIMV